MVGAILAAILTTGATGIIFFERFAEGAWTYLIFIPILYWFFSYTRSRMGDPTPEEDYLGQLDAAQLAGFGFGQAEPSAASARFQISKPSEITWQAEPKTRSRWREQVKEIKRVALLLDGSFFAAQGIPLAVEFSKTMGASLTLLSSVKDHTQAYQEQFEDTKAAREVYLQEVFTQLEKGGLEVDFLVRPSFISDATKTLVDERSIDIVITTTRGKSGAQHWLSGGMSRKLAQKLDIPILLVKSLDEKKPAFNKVLVALDGSIRSEQVLPYARAIAKPLDSELILLSVPEVPEVRDYRAAADVVERLRSKAEKNMQLFLNAIARFFREEGFKIQTLVSGNRPATTIVDTSREYDADLIMITSRGRGGMDLFMMGSVAHRIVEQTDRPVLLVPVHEDAN
jgi:nucleotide-binding universal stress UspA family protein